MAAVNARLTKRQAKATKCIPARVSGSCSKARTKRRKITVDSVRGKGARATVELPLEQSALSHERDAILAAGMDDFLRKPLRREEIFEALARHLPERYSYRDDGPTVTPEAAPVGRPSLTALPEQLRRELAEAVVHLHSRHIEDVIKRVAEHDAPAGEFLARVAKRSAYTEILNALNGSNGRRDTDA